MHPHADARLVDGLASYLHWDHLVSVTVITNDQGASATTRDFTPHGDMEGHEWVDPITQPESKGFIGERFDPETGLQYLNARYDVPKLGLFTQSDWWDPTIPGVGTNRYIYSHGDPVNFSDRNGHIAPLVGAFIPAIARVAVKAAIRATKRSLAKRVPCCIGGFRASASRANLRDLSSTAWESRRRIGAACTHYPEA